VTKLGGPRTVSDHRLSFGLRTLSVLAEALAAAGPVVDRWLTNMRACRLRATVRDDSPSPCYSVASMAKEEKSQGSDLALRRHVHPHHSPTSTAAEHHLAECMTQPINKTEDIPRRTQPRQPSVVHTCPLVSGPALNDLIDGANLTRAGMAVRGWRYRLFCDRNSFAGA